MTKTVGTFNFIFIGRSGSGKGTQSELLKKVLETRYGDGSVFYIWVHKQALNFIIIKFLFLKQLEAMLLYIIMISASWNIIMVGAENNGVNFDRESSAPGRLCPPPHSIAKWDRLSA